MERAIGGSHCERRWGGSFSSETGNDTVKIPRRCEKSHGEQTIPLLLEGVIIILLPPLDANALTVTTGRGPTSTHKYKRPQW